MIKFEFPADRTDIALAIGQALLVIAGQPVAAVTHAVVESVCTDELIEDVRGQAQSGNALDAAAVADLQASEAANEVADNTPMKSAGSSKVDQKGVPFDPQMCADAAEPFYKSGKYKGQWKKKGGAHGPTQEAYDAWHAGQLVNATAPAANDTPDTAPDVDVSKVWSAPAAADTKPAPSNAGELFAWVAAAQAANHLVQADVDAAYTAVGLNVGQLFSAPPADQAQMVAALHGQLSAKVPA